MKLSAIFPCFLLLPALLRPGVVSADGGGERLEVQERVALAADPAQLWALVGDFGGVGRWHPAVASVALSAAPDNTIGAVRTVALPDGAKIIETLIAYDGAARRYSYRLDSSPLPVTDYVAQLQVRPADGGSVLEWSSHFRRSDAALAAGMSVAEVKEIVAGIYRGGFDGVQAKLREAAAR